jgi:hypothetical protein
VIVLVDTPAYQQTYDHKEARLADDVALINKHLSRAKDKRTAVIPILLEGKLAEQSVDFRDGTHYAVGLFDLVLTLYAIPFDHPAFKPLREALQQQWEQVPLAKTTSHIDLTKLREILGTRLDAGELHTLCFDLGLDYNDLPGEGTKNKARELVVYLDKRVRIEELVEWLDKSRPDVLVSEFQK